LGDADFHHVLLMVVLVEGLVFISPISSPRSQAGLSYRDAVEMRVALPKCAA